MINAVKELLTVKIGSNNDTIFISEKREGIYIIDTLDKSDLRVHLTFVFWDNSHKVNILIDNYEIVDEDFKTVVDLLNLIKVLLSNTVIKSEKFQGSKIVYRIYEYSILVDGHEKRLKDRNNLSFLNCFGNFTTEVKTFETWF